jgi:negative regulator of replication initiation
MHRTQIYLQDELYEKLKARSRRLGVSVSELIRRSVEKDIGKDPAVDAKAFFEHLVPLESFADIEPEQSRDTAVKYSSVGEAFAELRAIMQEEHYTLEIPPRTDRPNVFADMLEEESPGGLSS